MPCFQGLAVSIHTDGKPLSEYSIQRQSRQRRITTYIPVPPPKIKPNSSTGMPEQNNFAISITLLTPGLHVPYSTPKPTNDDPYPRPKIVGGLPYDTPMGISGANSVSMFNRSPTPAGVIAPYAPMTTSPNETLAAYIYFDGRVKEEVATLLRRGEETWVNSRWVSVPESEGGGLAEREFLFREVGLERWLNGLDLEGNVKEVAARIQRRKQKLEAKRRKKESLRKENGDTDDDHDHDHDHDGAGEKVDAMTRRAKQRHSVLKYSDDRAAPVESLSGEDSSLGDSDDDSSDDEEVPMPEAAGQIKVALYRVLASGEIKRGEYSPQFDAHDDDEGFEGGKADGAGGGGGEDIDHTTSFAKPKSLDPKTISTQTVTGIDPPDKPYAVFTFLYRGERQLRKMGILSDPAAKTPTATKRKSGTIDFSKLQPLKATSTAKNFAGYRDKAAKRAAAAKDKKNRGSGDEDDDMDSDVDDEEDYMAKIVQAGEEDEANDTAGKLLSPEDAIKQERLAEGVRRIKLKRAHSSEPVLPPSATNTASAKASAAAPSSSSQPQPSRLSSPATALSTPSPLENGPSRSSSITANNTNGTSSSANNHHVTKSSAASDAQSGIDPAMLGSPFKKARSSLADTDVGVAGARKAAEVFGGKVLEGNSGGSVSRGFVAGDNSLAGALGSLTSPPLSSPPPAEVGMGKGKIKEEEMKEEEL